MYKVDTALHRLLLQQIGRHDFEKPNDLVGWFGAVQAQDWYGAKWALGLRLKNSSDAKIEKAIDDGLVLRMHAMRGTWQFVAKGDVRWIVPLFRSHVIARAAGRHRELRLDAKTLSKALAAIERALRGKQMTRAEIAATIEDGGVSTKGQRLSHILAVAELELVITSGAGRRYALVDDRVPASKSKALDRKDALAKLAQRYLQSRAPATASDFQWWTGLPIAECREALAGAMFESPRGKPRERVHLLPAFDEWLIGYRDRRATLDRPGKGGGMLDPVIVQDGRVVGTWSRTLGKKVTVKHRLFARADYDRAELAKATQRYLDFLG